MWVIGGGLAGCEAALQLALAGEQVTLWEQRPVFMPPDHATHGLAELVCSNSLKNNAHDSGHGLIKEELRRLGSVLMACADATAIPAGAALAVDREAFSRAVEACIAAAGVKLVRERCEQLPPGKGIVAMGPLGQGAIADQLTDWMGQRHFYDAAAPVITDESIDKSQVFTASRHGKGGDYLNLPLSKDQYLAFRQSLLEAPKAPVHGFEDKAVFEGCLPVEVLAARGEDTLRYGPLKPVGLIDPATGTQPYAVVQLRREDARGSLWNLVGFQTRLTFGAQKRIFGALPGLADAEFARYGVMHRNTFFATPGKLTRGLRIKGRDVWLAGQITGGEGYLAAMATGLVAARSLLADLRGKPEPDYTAQTMTGALAAYISGHVGDYQPMAPNFGIVEPPGGKVPKALRGGYLADRALYHIEHMAPEWAFDVKQKLGGAL